MEAQFKYTDGTHLQFSNDHYTFFHTILSETYFPRKNDIIILISIIICSPFNINYMGRFF